MLFFKALAQITNNEKENKKANRFPFVILSMTRRKGWLDMKTHIKTLALTGLALAFCFTPISNAQAHDSGRYEEHYTRQHHNMHNKNKDYYNRRMKHARYKYKHPEQNKIVLNNVIVHKRTPSKVIYVYNKGHDDNYRDKLIAVTLAQTALLLMLD